MWMLLIIILTSTSYSDKLNMRSLVFLNEKLCENAKNKIENMTNDPENLHVICFQTK